MDVSPAERADVIIDFTNAAEVVYLENILVQDDGRGPDGDIRIPGTKLIKFIVEGGVVADGITVAPGTPLRPHTPILKEEIVRTRQFEFVRNHGAWMINSKFFDPERDDATPLEGSAERWILKNGGGGWAHPIHIHLEAHQIQKINGQPPALYDSFKKDTIQLIGGDEAEVFIKFRTFPGRYVFHCHNLEHEDMRMMGVFNVLQAALAGSGQLKIQETSSEEYSVGSNEESGSSEETLSVYHAVYTSDEKEWSIGGKSTMAGPGNTITIYLGSTLNGQVLGTTEVNEENRWRFRRNNLSIRPDGQTTVSVESSRGASLLGVPLNIQ